jgi:hypothetical protein
VDRDAAAQELGRHYVAGHIEADDLDRRLTTLYGPGDESTALADLPALERRHTPEVRRAGWWRFRHGESATAKADWVPTTERFVDPTTQRVMRVWTDPASQARHYVAEP